MSKPDNKESIVNETDQETILNPLTPIQVALMGFLNSAFTSCVDVLVKNWDKYSQLKQEHGAARPLLVFRYTDQFARLEVALNGEGLYPDQPAGEVTVSVIQMVFQLAAERVSAQAD